MSPAPARSLAAGLPRLAIALTLLSSLSGCYALFHHREPDGPQDVHVPSPSPSIPPAPLRAHHPGLLPTRVAPLPGGLDDTEVFNSNSPEIIQDAGILLSTLPVLGPGDGSVYLNHPFSGRFALFSHHLSRDPKSQERVLFLGLVATNRGGRPLTLGIARGATFLTQPDAPFVPLPAIAPDPQGRIFAGPGDRTSGELLHDRSPIPSARVTIPANRARLLYSLPIPGNTAGDTPANGRTTELDLNASGPVYLSEVAFFAIRSKGGGFKVPSLPDYQALIDQKVLAGRREAPASLYEPDWKQPEGFRYGRVAGVSKGNLWKGELLVGEAPLRPGERVGYPISALYPNGYGTRQIQSADLVCRYQDTAIQAQGNYGVTYELSFALANPDPEPRTFALSLSNPAKLLGEPAVAEIGYQEPPDPQVMYRGTIRTDWFDEKNQPQIHFTHVVLHRGEEVPPFERITVAPNATTHAMVRLRYPADATPPQLFTIACCENHQEAKRRQKHGKSTNGKGGGGTHILRRASQAKE